MTSDDGGEGAWGALSSRKHRDTGEAEKHRDFMLGYNKGAERDDRAEVEAGRVYEYES